MKCFNYRIKAQIGFKNYVSKNEFILSLKYLETAIHCIFCHFSNQNFYKNSTDSRAYDKGMLECDFLHSRLYWNINNVPIKEICRREPPPHPRRKKWQNGHRFSTADFGTCQAQNIFITE